MWHFQPDVSSLSLYFGVGGQTFFKVTLNVLLQHSYSLEKKNFSNVTFKKEVTCPFLGMRWYLDGNIRVKEDWIGRNRERTVKGKLDSRLKHKGILDCLLWLKLLQKRQCDLVPNKAKVIYSQITVFLLSLPVPRPWLCPSPPTRFERSRCLLKLVDSRGRLFSTKLHIQEVGI